MGPNENDYELLLKLAKTMDVARFNFSHGNHEEHLARLEMLRKARKEVGRPIAALLDTKGPEIRTGVLEGGNKITLQEGDEITLTTEEVVGTKQKIYINYEHLHEDVKPGNVILIDDGLIGLEVLSVNGQEIHCKVTNGGELGERKGVNVPNVPIQLPSITEKDIEDIRFGISEEFDFIAASFVRSADAIRQIRALLDEAGSQMKIIAKIESQEGLDNLDSIIDEADGIMVARGDLGVEVEARRLPHLQREIIEKCACFVLERLSQTLNEAETDIKKLFTAKQSEIIYSFFRGAVVKPSNFFEQVVPLDGIETYKFNGKSRKIDAPDIGKYKAIVGYILKLTEVNMRKMFGSKRSLQPPAIKQVEKCFFNDKSDYGYYAGSHISKLSSWKRKMLEALYEDSFEETIIQAISDFIKEENIVIKNGKLEIIKPIEIDLSKIKDIERDHIETAKRLILEEDIERDEGQLSEIYNCKKNYRQQEINLINKAEVQSNNESDIKSKNDANAAKIPLPSISQISKIDAVHIVDGSYENESQSIGQLNIFDFAKETITDEGNKPEIETKHYDNAELSGCQAVINVLSNEAKDLISHLANGEKTGLNYELLVEEINEKALEITGDNLIEYVSGEPQIYEDYLNEVKEAVGGR